MARLGVELGARAIRGVRVEGWHHAGTRAVEIEWDRENPEEALHSLRQHLGAARRIAVAVDLPLLYAKRVQLPALPAAERRNILRLEPERFFAIRGEEVVPAVGGWGGADNDLVFAVREGPLAGWVAALERIAPVELVEPVPAALSRVLARGHVTDAVTLFDAGRPIRGRHRREFGLAAALCGAALVCALAALDGWRARATRDLTAGLQALRERAAPALALATQLDVLNRQAEAIRQVRAERPDPLRVLLALSRRLPPGAFLRGIRQSAAEWQIDGHAANAARLIGELGSPPEVQDVHFLSATNRAQIGDRTYESFALAFRYAPAP